MLWSNSCSMNWCWINIFFPPQLFYRYFKVIVYEYIIIRKDSSHTDVYCVYVQSTIWKSSIMAPTFILFCREIPRISWVIIHLIFLFIYIIYMCIYTYIHSSIHAHMHIHFFQPKLSHLLSNVFSYFFKSIFVSWHDRFPYQ